MFTVAAYGKAVSQSCALQTVLFLSVPGFLTTSGEESTKTNLRQAAKSGLTRQLSLSWGSFNSTTTTTTTTTNYNTNTNTNDNDANDDNHTHDDNDNDIHNHAVRPALFGRVVARSGSVRFVSASGSGRFRN